jgi:hypothetical protein
LLLPKLPSPNQGSLERFKTPNFLPRPSPIKLLPPPQILGLETLAGAREIASPPPHYQASGAQGIARVRAPFLSFLVPIGSPLTSASPRVISFCSRAPPQAREATGASPPSGVAAGDQRVLTTARGRKDRRRPSKQDRRRLPCLVDRLATSGAHRSTANHRHPSRRHKLR